MRARAPTPLWGFLFRQAGGGGGGDGASSVIGVKVSPEQVVVAAREPSKEKDEDE